MSWLVSNKILESDYKGRFTMRTICGVRSIWYSLFLRSSRYEAKKISWTLKKLREHNPKRVLVIHAHTGGEIKAVQKVLKNAHITFIDTSLTTIHSIAQTGYIQKPEAHIYQDAFASVVTGTFDVIMYTPKIGTPKEVLEKEIQQLPSLLNRDGYILFSLGTTKETKEIAKKYISRRFFKSWKRDKVAVYMRFGRGERMDPIPSYYKEFLNCPEFLEREATIQKKLTVIHNSDGTLTTRWEVLPFLTTETHIGETEPIVEKEYPRMRIIQWQPIYTVPQAPKGWLPFFSNLLMTQHGTTPLKVDYYKDWSTQAQRKRKAFLNQSECTIEEISLDEYCKWYYEAQQPSGLKQMLIKATKEKRQAHGELLRIWGVRDAQNRICAGLAILDIPEAQTSVHTSAFTLKKFCPPFAGTALIDHWYQHGLKQGQNRLDFAIIRSKYDPKSWEGYSQFKRQFVQDLILFKKPLLTFRMPYKKN